MLANGLTIRNSLIKGHNVLLKACVNLKEYSFPSAESIRTAFGLENFPVAGAEEEEPEKSACLCIHIRSFQRIPELIPVYGLKRRLSHQDQE
jgi:hypothetical protein